MIIETNRIASLEPASAGNEMVSPSLDEISQRVSTIRARWDYRERARRRLVGEQRLTELLTSLAAA